jgi:zinc transport system permease protein
MAAGIRTWAYDYLFSVLTGVAVIISVPVVGVLLIAALLVLPGLASLQVSRSMRQSMLISIAFGVLSVILGLVGSIVLDTASGAMIVIAALGILLAVGFSKWMKMVLGKVTF